MLYLLLHYSYQVCQGLFPQLYDCESIANPKLHKKIHTKFRSSLIKNKYIIRQGGTRVYFHSNPMKKLVEDPVKTCDKGEGLDP